METSLKKGLNEMKIDLSLEMQESLFKYLDILVKWNKVFNLTSVCNKKEMVSRHLLDCLSIIPWIRGNRILDAGTGAGLPGIPLAVALPKNFFYLIDSSSKKTRFLHEVVAELDLNNVVIVNKRLEAFQDSIGFDVVTCRAFASLFDFTNKTKHLLSSNGFWLAMKGEVQKSEIDEVKLQKIDKYLLQVPGSKKIRYLYRIIP
tara:strand:+ start:180 stop:788 length:609 start_codon:yes stop_codon:yes gene_type:complete